VILQLITATKLQLDFNREVDNLRNVVELSADFNLQRNKYADFAVYKAKITIV
jgi:hypothetical protein